MHPKEEKEQVQIDVEDVLVEDVKVAPPDEIAGLALRRQEAGRWTILSAQGLGKILGCGFLALSQLGRYEAKQRAGARLLSHRRRAGRRPYRCTSVGCLSKVVAWGRYGRWQVIALGSSDHDGAGRRMEAEEGLRQFLAFAAPSSFMIAPILSDANRPTAEHFITRQLAGALETRGREAARSGRLAPPHNFLSRLEVRPN